MKNKSYIGLGIIILVFGYWFLPKIFNRINTNQTIDSNRTMSIDQSSKLSFIKLNGSARKVPDFIFINQDSLYVGNEDFFRKSLCCRVFLYIMPINLY
jgi:protein SCO1/2